MKTKMNLLAVGVMAALSSLLVSGTEARAEGRIRVQPASIEARQDLSIPVDHDVDEQGRVTSTNTKRSGKAAPRATAGATTSADADSAELGEQFNAAKPAEASAICGEGQSRCIDPAEIEALQVNLPEGGSSAGANLWAAF